ncbi:MAG: hypothetical protein ACK47B_02600 [Armatimonadota bacterium]
MSGRTPLPEGHEELRMERRYGARIYRDYLGHHRRTEPIGFLRSRSDGRHHPFDKRELLPAGLWDLHEAVQAAALAAGLPYAQVLAAARRLLPGFLQSSCGQSRPDLPTEPVDARGIQPEPGRLPR